MMSLTTEQADRALFRNFPLGKLSWGNLTKGQQTIQFVWSVKPAFLSLSLTLLTAFGGLSQAMADTPSWMNYSGVPYEEIQVDGKPLDRVQADGNPDEDLRRFKVTPIPRWEPLLPKSRFDPSIRNTKKFQSKIPSTDFFWLDNRTLIANVWRLHEWEAADGELPKIVLMDADTGKITETRYRGSIVCVTPERLVVAESPVDGAGKGLTRIGKVDFSKVRVGKFGEDLVPILPPDQPQVVHISYPVFVAGSCAPAPRPEEFPGFENFSILRLWPGGGYVGHENRGNARLPPGSKPLSGDWVIFDAQKRPIKRQSWSCQWANWHPSPAIKFLPSLGGYSVATTGKSGRKQPNDEGEQCPFIMIKPNGEITPLFYPPPLIVKWKGLASMFMTAEGPIWATAQSFRFTGNRYVADDAANLGLYALNGFRLVRVLRGRVSLHSPVSPDGCRLLVFRAPAETPTWEAEGDHDQAYRTTPFELINFCERGQS